MDMAMNHPHHPATTGLNRAAKRAMDKAARRQSPAPAHERHVSTAATARLLNSTTPFGLDAANEVLLYAHLALAAFDSGDGDDGHYGALANVTNIGAILAANGIGAEAADIFADAQRALMRVRARFNKIGRYGFAGPERTLLCDALANHELQLIDSHLKVEQLRDALHEAAARIANKDVLTMADVFPEIAA